MDSPVGVASSRPWFLLPHYLTLFLVLILICGWLGLRMFCRRRRTHLLRLKDPLKAHCWQTGHFLDKPTYCNSCTQMCFSGSSCVSCGLSICTDSSCVNVASSSKACKPLATPPGSGPTRHFWVKGNLPLYSFCFKCLGPCGQLPKLVDFRCVWCQRTAHEDCMTERVDLEEGGGACSLGPYQSCIVPPSCVTLSLEGWRGRRR